MVISYELAISFEVWGIVGFVTMGALGGVSLGLALKRKVVALALLGAIGFGAGIFAGFYIGEEFGGEYLGLAFILAFTVAGMIGGVALGLALRNWRNIIGLTLAGAIGFFIGSTGGMSILSFSLAFIPMGIIVYLYQSL